MVNKITTLNIIEKRRIIHFIFLLLSALTAAFIWICYLSQGFSQPGILDAFIEIQACAIQKGQLAITPDYHHFFYHDVSLYKGNYYFYWGLLPALLHAFLSILVGRVISSYFIVFLFLFILFYFFQRIIFEIMNTATPESSPQSYLITGATVILAWIFIFILPFPYEDYTYSWFFGRFVIYEQQILFGLGLALPGLFYLIRGLKKNSPVLLIAACCFFAAAAWVRGTWFLFSIIAIPIIFVGLLIKKSSRSSLKWPLYIFMMIPILLIGGLLVLNYVRFNDIFDFGMQLQFPIDYTDTYLRLQNGIFSPMTHFYNILFKILSYYTSPSLIQMWDLSAKSASWAEFAAPYLFHNNPLLLLFVPVVLYGAYRAFRTNRNMLKIIIVLGSTAVIINGVIVTIGNVVNMRYFVECYYLTLLLIFAGLTAALSAKITFPILMLIISLHFPGNIKAFMAIQPELRLVKIIENTKNHLDYKIISPMRTFSIFSDIYWPEGIVTGAPGTFKRHNAFGMVPRKIGGIYAWDVSAVYIKPQNMKELAENRSLLEFIGIKSVSKAGRIRVYLEKTRIAEFSIVPWAPRTYKAKINYNLKDNAPHKLLIYFFEKNKSYLPAKQSNLPSFLFETIRLSRS